MAKACDLKFCVEYGKDVQNVVCPVCKTIPKEITDED